jgi:putative transposase
MPRGGSPVERIFGATEEEVIAQMEGNTRQLKHARETSKSHDPFERAAWTLYATYRAFEKYFFEVRPVRSHPMLGMTPNEYEAKRLAETGQREHRLVAYDQNLMLATCLPTPRGKHKFDKRRGIQSDGQWYRHPDMAVLKDGEKVEVLLEPWLFNVIYVYVRDHWVAAVGTSSRAAPGRSRREVNIAVRAEKRLALKNAAKDRLKPENLRSISALLKPESFDERLNKQQRELRHLFSRLGATTTALEVPADLLEQSDKAASKVAAALEKTAPTTAASGTPKTDNGPETAPSSAQDQALVELDGFEDNSEYEEMEDVEGTF